MEDNGGLFSGNNLLWLIVIGIIVAAIIVLVISRSDDDESKEVQDENDRNLLPWVVGIGAVALVVGIAWYYGMFKEGPSGEDMSVKAASKTPQQVNRERLAQSSKSARSARSARSAPRGSLSARSTQAAASTSTSARSAPRGSLSTRRT